MDLKKLYHDAMNDDLVNSEMLNKHRFENYLTGLFIKLAKVNTPEARNQMEIIEQMQRDLERQKYILALHNLQARMLRDYTRQIVNLERYNKDLKEENNNLKSNI